MTTLKYCLALFVIGVIFYGVTLKGVAGDIAAGAIKNNLDQATKPFELSPERGRYILTYSLAHNRTFSLTKELAEAAYPDVGYYQGKYYIYFVPGISLLAWPAYEIGEVFHMPQVASFASIACFAIGNMLMLFVIGKQIFRLSSRTAMLPPIIFAFASTSWSYAVTLYQHHVTTFLILCSFYALWRYRMYAKRSVVWASVILAAYGLGLMIDYSNAFLLLPLLLYLGYYSIRVLRMEYAIRFHIRPEVILSSVFLVLLLGLHGYYNYVNFGSWHRLSGSLVGVKDIVETQQRTGFVSDTTIAQLQAQKDPSKFFREEHFPGGIYELLLAPDKGLFIFSPIFVIALFGMWLRWQRASMEDYVVLAFVLVSVLLYASFGDPWGGWAFGPRYLIPAMALLSLYIGAFVNHFRYALGMKLVTFWAFVPSAAIALLGALTTNAVPPKVEADFLHTGYNYLLNIRYLKAGQSSSFFYNSFAKPYLTLGEFYIIIFTAVCFVGLILLLIKDPKPPVIAVAHKTTRGKKQ